MEKPARWIRSLVILAACGSGRPAAPGPDVAANGGGAGGGAGALATAGAADSGVLASSDGGGRTSTGGASGGSGGTMSKGDASGSAGNTSAAGASGSRTTSSGGASGGGTISTGGANAASDCAPSPSPLAGWAAVAGNGVNTTTGGDGGSTLSVSDLAALQAAVKGADKHVIEIRGSIQGNVAIGSNKTLVGCAGAQFTGHLSIDKSVNVIVRNLMLRGYNCSDNPSDCSGGADAITVQGAAHHVWFDHDDIADGSDGNLDITHAADYVTVSFTKFHYTGRRNDPAGASGGHQFSNLIGHSDSNASEDKDHLRITFHHDWWADNAVERMPRVRFGQVHLFDNLYTASGNDYCIGVGVGANVLTENNVFVGVKTPIDTTGYSDGASVIHNSGNLYMGTTGAMPAELSPSRVFMPPYAYSLDSTQGLQAAIESFAGPQ